MNFKKKLLLALILCVGISINAKAQTILAFKSGDRVAFVGNSITDGGHYHAYIWMYYMTHFPNMRITCYNVGIGGDNVQQMRDRFEAEVLSKKPTVMTLTWGMNDSGYFEWYKPDAKTNYAKWSVDTAEARYAVFDKKLNAHPEIKKIFILGSPYDSTTTSNKNRFYPGKFSAFERLIDFQEATAKKNGWHYVDFNHPMTAINREYQKADTNFSLTPYDRIHPDYAGHLVMAYLFLKAQGLAGKPVADFAVNAKTKAVSKSENCIISNVSGNENNVSFDYLANSLPFAFDTVEFKGPWGQHGRQIEGVKYVPFMQDFDKEMLTVKDLKSGTYELSMDGQAIGRWSAKDLEAGINLAEQTYTPEYQQSLAILTMNEERWEIERRLRTYAYVEFDLLKQKKLLYADNRAAMDTVNKESKKNPFIGGNRDNYIKAQYKAVREGWQREQDALVDEIYAVNKPKVHHIILQLMN
ncbi:SGNH/GDSL hydrolase family protein [Mucilaginibacter sp.]